MGSYVCFAICTQFDAEWNVSPKVPVSLCDPEIMSICSIEIEMAYFYFSGVGQQYI